MGAGLTIVKRIEDIPNYDPKEPEINIDHETPRISFKNLDNDLRLQFYKLCPPVLLRDLYHSSKMVNEIKCPPTYVSKFTKIGFIPSFYKPEELDSSKIIEVRGCLHLAAFDPGETSKYIDSYNFHHQNLVLDCSRFNSEEFKIIVNPNVTKIEFNYKCLKHQTLAMFLERMPYLEEFTYRDDYEIPNLITLLFNWKQKAKLKKISIECPVSSINKFLTNPELMAKFMNRQEDNFVIFVKHQEFHSTDINAEILEYFSEEENADNGRHLIFKFPRNYFPERIFRSKVTPFAD